MNSKEAKQIHKEAEAKRREEKHLQIARENGFDTYEEYKKSKAKEYHKRWYQENKAEADAKHYEYRKSLMKQETADKLDEQQKEWREAHKEEMQAYRKKYYQENKEYFKQKSLEQGRRKPRKTKRRWNKDRKKDIMNKDYRFKTIGELLEEGVDFFRT